MYQIFFMMTDSPLKYVHSQNGRPVLFPTEEEAWDFINQMMAMEVHPKFMWMKEIKNANH